MPVTFAFSTKFLVISGRRFLSIWMMRDATVHERCKQNRSANTRFFSGSNHNCVSPHFPAHRLFARLRRSGAISPATAAQTPQGNG